MQPITRLRIAIARSIVAFLALAFVWWCMPAKNLIDFAAIFVVVFIAACFLVHALVLIIGYQAIKESVRKAMSG